ncbi:MAG: phage integrase family protein [Mesorhizobium sp.]|nr:MAG: phage integrase family protein [Mesorhizobium sp.]
MRHRKPKYINEYIDRHGRPRIYLRRPGMSQVALPTPLYSQEFWTAYHAAMANAPVKAGRLKPGSVAAAVHGYYSSIEFKSLAGTTQAVYRCVLDRFVGSKYGAGPIAGMQAKHVNTIIDEMASTPAAASNFRKRLSAVMDYAVSAGMRADNPVTGAKRVRYESDGHRTWTEEDIAAYRKKWKIGTPERLAMEVLLHTGLRRSDAVRVGWKHVAGGRIEITAQKTGAELSIPIRAELMGYIKTCPRDGDAFIAKTGGAARSDKAFSAYISGAAAKANLPSGSSPHGLRKAACRRLAEAGCSARQIMAITGHTDIREVERYCREAEKKLLADAAMAKLDDHFDVQKLPNQPDELGKSGDNELKSLVEKGAWRSRQDSNLRPSA